MANLTLLAATAISLLAATPVLAVQRGHHHHRYAYSRAYRAYGFYRGGDFAPGNVSEDFARRNTFN